MYRFLIIGLTVIALVLTLASLMLLDKPALSHSISPSFSKSPRVRPTSPPLTVVRGFSGSLSPSTPPADRKTNILRLFAAGEVLLAQTAISEWFSADPITARNWLETQPSWREFQPAISQIAKEMAECGYPVEALAWADLLESEHDREQTAFEIYATGRRYNWLTDDQIRAAPLSLKKIENLLSGAADD